MKRRAFLQWSAATAGMIGAGVYAWSDKKNFVRKDAIDSPGLSMHFKPGEREILRLASLAPSGHNTQPWKIKYLQPYHWIIGNDRARWLPAVDPAQRETILSIGAFLQNLEYAAGALGYSCSFEYLATINQATDLVEVRLRQTAPSAFEIRKIENRRTLRSGFASTPLETAHINLLTGGEKEFFHFIAKGSNAFAWLKEATIEANRIQTYRDDAQGELANWMRLSNKEAGKHNDGLTTASMEINNFPGWLVRNFYAKEDVMKKSFRDQGLKKLTEQVHASGGWMLITSNDNATRTLLETGMRLQRMLLNTRELGIAVHPITQVLEEKKYADELSTNIGISQPVQFILRTGYITNYPEPVSLRRPVESFVTEQPG